jgi:hypothetical protein
VGIIVPVCVRSSVASSADTKEYQRHAVHMLRGLEEAYEAPSTLKRELLGNAFDAIEGQLRCYRSGAFDLPPKPHVGPA